MRYVNHISEVLYIKRILGQVRKAINNFDKRLNCNKVALAHNRDDVIETLLMSTFYEGRINTFPPVTYLARTQLHVIRPLIYVEEKPVRRNIEKRPGRLAQMN